MTAVYLLAGEPFLADEALGKIRAEAGGDALAEVSFPATADPTDVLGALETPSLLGGGRLVIVRDAGDLKKDALEALTRYIGSPSPSSTLVLIAARKSPKLAAVVKKAGAVIDLEPPKGRKLVTWLRERARNRNLKLDDAAAWATIDAIGPELRDLDGALQQLATARGSGATISTTDVRAAFPRLSDERVYAFTDAVGERRLADAMGTLRRLLGQGDNPLMLFGALSGHVRRMLTVRSLADHGAAAVGDALGMPEWRARKLHQQVRSYREEELVDAMAVLAATDVEMKGGDLPPEIALERAVIKIVTGS